MQIRKIIPQDKKKQRVYLDDDTVFSLYNGEIYRFHLQEEGEISSELLSEIFGILKKRARERCFYLLKDSDKTEEQIRRKLKEGYYPPSVIEETIAFLKSYHYLDDARYAEAYIRQMREKKSRREIFSKLTERGVPGEVIGRLLEETEWNEEISLQLLLEKKLRGKDAEDKKIREKLFAYFYRKGYSVSAIECAYAGYLSEKKENDNL